MRNKDKGFTLIELLVVIIIIGILAAIAIPIFLNQRKKGVDASIKSDVKNMATQVETFYTNSQKYPVPVGGTGPDIVGTSNPITVGGETVPVSSGNVLIYSLVGTTGYRICGSNPNGTATGASTDFFVYNSTTGGLAAGGPTACP
jgi:prepilin-type N-terminal cleavage/methylation domain-containing protein